MMDKLIIAQWNTGRSAAAINAFLPSLAEDETPPHLIIIQEPPWYQVGLAPSLTNAEGTPIQGVPTIPNYVSCLPPHDPDTRPRVVTYVSRNIPPSQWSIVGEASSGTDVLTVEVRSEQTSTLR